MMRHDGVLLGVVEPIYGEPKTFATTREVDGCAPQPTGGTHLPMLWRREVLGQRR